VVDLLVGFIVWVEVEGGGFARFKGCVGGGGEDAVEPGLLVFVPGGGEGGAGELFGVETVGGLLGAVCTYGEGAGDGFGFMVRAEAIQIPVFFLHAELGGRHRARRNTPG